MKAPDYTIDSTQIAGGAQGLLDEIAASKITGEEDIFSHTDLWDFNANLQGSQTAVASVRPILDERNPDLGKRVDQRFDGVRGAAGEVPRGRRIRAVRQGDRTAAPRAVALDRRIQQGSQPGARCHRTPVVSRTSASPHPNTRAGLSRRKLFGAAGVTACGGRRGGRGRAGRPGVCGRDTHVHLHTAVPFRGEHQAGIVTEAQDRMHFATFDVTTNSRDDVVKMLADWTEMAERMTQGKEAFPNGAAGQNPYYPPFDTGEALGLPASQLTLTIGFGPAFFVKDGVDRFGIADKQPAELVDLPKFPNETIDPAKSGGDIACRPAPTTLRSPCTPIRNLARIGFGTAAVRYSQLGFGRTSSTTREPVHPAKPVRVQGRNGQPQARGDRQARTTSSGSPTATARRG